MFLVSLAEGFIHLFQAAGKIFLDMMTGLIPMLICLLLAINFLMKLVGTVRMEKVAAPLGRSRILTYGVLPVLSQAGVQYGYTTLELGVASLLGQAFHLLSPLVAFIYLLLEMTEQDLGEWQRKAAKWALGIFIIFVAVAAITGSVPLRK